jgi:hypothetical protein
VKGKILVLSALIILFCLPFIVQVNATGSSWREDFNYASVSQMQAAGWSVSRPGGTSIDNGAVVLNGVGGDSAINIRNIFSSAVYDWKAEAKNMWLGHGHSTQSITVYTEKHKYVWSADGYYNEFALYRDDVKILRFGKYAEAANIWITLTMEKNGNTISMYFNGQLENTYTEKDTTLAKVTGVGLVSPWAGDAKYDYVWVEDASVVGPPPTSTPIASSPTSTGPSSSAPAQSSFPTMPVLIGAGIAVAVGIGAAVYYFVVAGGSAGASAGAGAGSAGTAGAGSMEGGGGSGSGSGDGDSGSGNGSGGCSGGGDSIIQEQHPSPLGGETPQSPLSGEIPQRPPGNMNFGSAQSSIDGLRYPGSGQLEPATAATPNAQEPANPLETSAAVDALRYPSNLPNLSGSSQPQTTVDQTPSKSPPGFTSNQTAPAGSESPSNLEQVTPQQIQNSMQNTQSSIDALRYSGSVPNLQTGQLESGPSSQMPISQGTQTNPPPEGTQSGIDALRSPSNMPDVSKKKPQNTETGSSE